MSVKTPFEYLGSVGFIFMEYLKEKYVPGTQGNGTKCTEESSVESTQENRKFSTVLPEVAFNLARIALPALALFGVAYIRAEMLEALMYGTCVFVCAGFSSGPSSVAACFVGCMAPQAVLSQ